MIPGLLIVCMSGVACGSLSTLARVWVIQLAWIIQVITFTGSITAAGFVWWLYGSDTALVAYSVVTIIACATVVAADIRLAVLYYCVRDDPVAVGVSLGLSVIPNRNGTQRRIDDERGDTDDSDDTATAGAAGDVESAQLRPSDSSSDATPALTNSVTNNGITITSAVALPVLPVPAPPSSDALIDRLEPVTVDWSTDWALKDRWYIHVLSALGFVYSLLLLSFAIDRARGHPTPATARLTSGWLAATIAVPAIIATAIIGVLYRRRWKYFTESTASDAAAAAAEAAEDRRRTRMLARSEEHVRSQPPAMEIARRAAEAAVPDGQLRDPIIPEL